MIFPTGPVRVMVAVQPVDFRKGIDGLAAISGRKEELGTDPYSGVVYVFRARRADRIKMIFWDGTGVVLISKRLEDGKFRWPRIEAGVMHLTRIGPRYSKVSIGPACMSGVCVRRRKCCDRSMLTHDIGDHKSVGM